MADILFNSKPQRQTLVYRHLMPARKAPISKLIKNIPHPWASKLDIRILSQMFRY